MLTPAELRDATCVACPGQHLPAGAFDVASRPDPSVPFVTAAGHRISTLTGAPTCVHPFRVALPPGLYRSAGEPLPSAATPVTPPDDALDLPTDPTLLEAWLIAVIRRAAPSRLAAALRRAETEARRAFPASDVVTALRRALTTTSHPTR